jgi:hypothetical protein
MESCNCSSEPLHPLTLTIDLPLMPIVGGSAVGPCRPRGQARHSLRLQSGRKSAGNEEDKELKWFGRQNSKREDGPAETSKSHDDLKNGGNGGGGLDATRCPEGAPRGDWPARAVLTFAHRLNSARETKNAFRKSTRLDTFNTRFLSKRKSPSWPEHFRKCTSMSPRRRGR